jgi:hypothetical protein
MAGICSLDHVFSKEAQNRRFLNIRLGAYMAGTCSLDHVSSKKAQTGGY